MSFESSFVERCSLLLCFSPANPDGHMSFESSFERCTVLFLLQPTQTVPHESVKPIKLTMAPRLAQSRAEILEKLYKDLGLNK